MEFHTMEPNGPPPGPLASSHSCPERWRTPVYTNFIHGLSLVGTDRHGKSGAGIVEEWARVTAEAKKTVITFIRAALARLARRGLTVCQN